MTSSQADNWKLGLFVLIGVGMLFGAFIWLGAARFSEEYYYAVTYVDESVQGLRVVGGDESVGKPEVFAVAEAEHG